MHKGKGGLDYLPNTNLFDGVHNIWVFHEHHMVDRKLVQVLHYGYALIHILRTKQSCVQYTRKTKCFMSKLVIIMAFWHEAMKHNKTRKVNCLSGSWKFWKLLSWEFSGGSKALQEVPKKKQYMLA